MNNDNIRLSALAQARRTFSKAMLYYEIAVAFENDDMVTLRRLLPFEKIVDYRRLGSAEYFNRLGDRYAEVSADAYADVTS